MAQLLSVIIPAFNAEKYLAQAVQSILTQAYSPVEIIVADDGSRDGTEQAAREFGNLVRYVYQENSGSGSARNLGLQLAQGELIGFLDADDLWADRKLEIQCKALEANPAVEAVFGHVQNYIEPAFPGQAPSLQAVLPGYQPGAMLIRKAALQRIGHFATEYRLGDTVDFFIRARELSLRELMLPDVVLYRRIHSDNSGVRRKAEQSNAYIHILKASLDRKRGKTSS